MDCRICLDKLWNSVTLDCGHTFCQPCIEESQITLCPICRFQFTTKIPSPWFNSRPSIDESEEPEELGELPKIKDQRGHLLIRQADMNTLRKSRRVFISKTPQCISDYQESEMNLKQLKDYDLGLAKKEYEEKIASIELKYQNDIATITRLRDTEIRADEANMKSIEHANENLNALADTCIALSTQSSDVLNIAAPIFKSYIEKSLFNWPLNLSPLFPEGELIYRHYAYMKGLNKMYCANVDKVYLDKKSINIHAISYIRIIDGLLYVQFCNGLNIYDASLRLVKFHRNTQTFFMGNRKICRIRSQTFTYMGNTYSVPYEKIGICDQNDDKIYLRSKNGTHIITLNNKYSYAKGTFYFYKLDKFYSYKHIGDYTHFLDYVLPGNGHIFSGALDTVIYQNGTYGKLISL